jgi:hypothetical protein
MAAYLSEFLAALKIQMIAKFSSLIAIPLAQDNEIDEILRAIVRPEMFQIVCN